MLVLAAEQVPRPALDRFFNAAKDVGYLSLCRPQLNPPIWGIPSSVFRCDGCLSRTIHETGGSPQNPFREKNLGLVRR